MSLTTSSIASRASFVIFHSPRFGSHQLLGNRAWLPELPMSFLFAELADNQDGIIAAESESVRHRSPERRLAPKTAGTIGDIIKVTLRIRLLVINGRRYLTMLDGQNCNNKFDCSRSAHRMTQHRLG